MLELYNNIKRYRKLLGITQQELALKAGYKDKSMIAKIEKGMIDLPISKIELIANILGIKAPELMGYSDPLEHEVGKPINLFSKPGKIIHSYNTPGIQFVSENGQMANYDISSFEYSILESVSKMPTEQQELVNNMVGGKKRKIIFIENPQNRKSSLFSEPNAAHTRTDIPVANSDVENDENIMDNENF